MAALDFNCRLSKSEKRLFFFLFQGGKGFFGILEALNYGFHFTGINLLQLGLGGAHQSNVFP